VKVRSKKNKGKRLQNWGAEMVSKITGLSWGHDSQPIRSREMGQCGVDIVLNEEARELFSFSVEAKNQEAWHFPAWIEQAKKNKVDGTDWLLLVKKNNIKPIIVIDANVFFKLCEENILWRKDK